FDTFTGRWYASQERLQSFLLPFLQSTLHLTSTTSLEETGRQLLTHLESALQNATGDVASAALGAVRTATGILRLALAVLLTPVFAIYFLQDYPRLRDAAKELIPPRHRPHVVSLVSEINHALASWVRGQLTVMLILGTLYATGLALTGIPLGIVIGMLTG